MTSSYNFNFMFQCNENDTKGTSPPLIASAVRGTVHLKSTKGAEDMALEPLAKLGNFFHVYDFRVKPGTCLLYTSQSPRENRQSRMQSYG